MSSFRRLEDLLEVEHLDGTPKFAQAHHRAKGAKGIGLRYEGKVQEHFRQEFGEFYIPGPWFRYRVRLNSGNWNYAQPDGILFDFRKGLVTIFEMKYTHTSDAYFQLVDKYLPLMRKFLGTELWTFATCEVVWWYDRAVAFPCEVRLRKNLKEIQPKELAVHICRPGAER